MNPLQLGAPAIVLAVAYIFSRLIMVEAVRGFAPDLMLVIGVGAAALLVWTALQQPKGGAQSAASLRP